MVFIYILCFSIVDSVQECCHTNDSALCFTCVMCVGDLLTSIEQLDRGVGIHGDSVKVIKEKYQQKHGNYSLGVLSRCMFMVEL